MTLYDDLGVSEDASADEVHKAYRARAREHHPDRTGNKDSSDFRKAKNAYEVLSKRESREAYDRSLDSDRNSWKAASQSRIVEVTPRSRSRVYEVRNASRSAGFTTIEEEFDRLLRHFFGF